MKKVLIPVAVSLCLAVSFYAWAEARCWWCDGQILRVPVEMIDFVESLEVAWQLDSGYGGRLTCDPALVSESNGYLLDYGIVSVIGKETIGQRGTKGTPLESLKPMNGWSDSGRIREAVEAGKDPVLMATVRIYDANGEIVYLGYKLSEPLSLARQRQELQTRFVD